MGGLYKQKVTIIKLSGGTGSDSEVINNKLIGVVYLHNSIILQK